jgi:methyltransferase
VRIALTAQADDCGYSGTATSAGWGGGQLSTSDETDAAQRMEQAIRRYYAACNTGDVDAVAAFFTPDAVHYVPPGYGGSPRGGRAIGEVIARLVQATASCWSIDQVVCDPGTNRAVIEWTVRRSGALARGAEWYDFEPGTGLITEIRAYLASPPAAGSSRLELEGFPYAERGYTMDS